MTASRSWPALVMAALAAAIFWRLFLGEGLSSDGGLVTYQPWSEVFATDPPASNHMLSDQFAYFNANEEFISRWVRRGVWPLWNSELAHGIPTTASIQTAEYYPTNLLLWPFPPFWTRGLRALLRIGLCFWGTYAFGRAVGMGRAGATVASMSFGVGGFNTVWLGFPVTNVSMALPGILWTLERLLQRGTFGWGAGLALFGGTALLGGHAPTVLHMSVVVAFWLVFRLASPAWPAPRLALPAGAWRIGVAGLVAACLGSAALLPWMEYLGESPGAAFASRNMRTLSWSALAVWIVPDFFGTPVGGAVDWGPRYGLAGWENYCERTGYVGVAGLLLAAVAIAARRPRRSIVPWVLGIVVCAVFVYDPPVVGALFRSLPGFHLVNNSKMVGVVAFCLAMLAGLGCDVVLERAGSRRGAWFGTSVATLMAAGLLFALWPNAVQRAAIVDAGAWAAFLRDCFWPLLPAGAVVAALALAPRRLTVATPLLVGVIAIDLWRFALGFNPTIPARDAAPVTPGIRYLQEHVTEGRILPIGLRLLPGNTATRFGIHDAGGHDWVNVSHYEYLVTGRTGNYNFGRRPKGPPPTTLALNVTHAVFPRGASVPPGVELVYDDEIRIMTIPRGQPRARVVHRVRAAPSDREALRMLAGGANLQRVALLSPSDVARAGTLSGAEPTATDRVQVTEPGPNELRVNVETESAGLLVVNDTWFPGWESEVDGRAVPILRANLAFRAVRIEPGRHEVVFRYRPWRARLGIALSLAALAGLTAVAVTRTLRRG